MTVGPRLKPVTWASTLNWFSVSVSDATIASLASVRSFGMEPGVRTSDAGSVYVTSPASESCSVRCGIGVGSGAGATGLEGTFAAAATAADAGAGAAGLSDPAATIPGVTSGIASVAFSPAAALPSPWAALIFSTAISAWVGRRTPGATGLAAGLEPDLPPPAARAASASSSAMSARSKASSPT